MIFNIPQLGEIALDKVPNILTVILRFLNDIGNGKLTVKDNLTFSTITTEIQSGVEKKVQHSFKNKPSVVVVVNGRTAVVQITDKTEQDFVVLAKLLSTTTTQTINDFVDRFEVQDASLFEVGDKLKIAVYEVTIRNIQGNLFTINKNIWLAGSTTVFLFKENCTFFLM